MVGIPFEPTKLQERLEDRGCLLSSQAANVRHEMIIRAREGNFESFNISAIIKKKKDVDAFREVELMDADEKEEEKAAIEAGVKKLAERILQDDAFPDVPDHVWDEAMHDKYSNTRPYSGSAVEEEHIAAIQEHLPSLDRDIIHALLDASDYDWSPQGFMIAFGSHFAVQGWDEKQLQKMLTGIHESSGDRVQKTELASKSYAELIVELTNAYLGNSNNACNRACGSLLEHTAGIVRLISSGELKQMAKKEGIAVGRDIERSSLVVKIVEHLYADALGPVDRKSGDIDETRHTKKSHSSKY